MENNKCIGLFFGSFNPPHIGHLNTVITVLNNCFIRSFLDEVWVIPAWHNPWKIKDDALDISKTGKMSDSTKYFLKEFNSYQYRIDMCQLTFKNKENPYRDIIQISNIEEEIRKSRLTNKVRKDLGMELLPEENDEDYYNYEYDYDYDYDLLAKTLTDEEREPNKVYTYQVIEYLQKKYPDIEFVIITTEETYHDIPKWNHGEDILNMGLEFIVVQWKHFHNIEKINFSKPNNTIYVYPDFDVDVSSTILRKKAESRENLYPMVNSDVKKYIKENGLYTIESKYN